jgi:hypothetical protein
MMQSGDLFPPIDQPSLVLLSSDEEVVLHVRGFAVLRATYEAEGYYDQTTDGDPEEQDLYLIEILDAAQAVRASEAVEGDAVWPLFELGLPEPTLRRLFPAERRSSGGQKQALVECFLLVLAFELRRETSPGTRLYLLAAAATWSPMVVKEAFRSLPEQWRRASRR